MLFVPTYNYVFLLFVLYSSRKCEYIVCRLCRVLTMLLLLNGTMVLRDSLNQTAQHWRYASQTVDVSFNDPSWTMVFCNHCVFDDSLCLLDFEMTFCCKLFPNCFYESYISINLERISTWIIDLHATDACQLDRKEKEQKHKLTVTDCK